MHWHLRYQCEAGLGWGPGARAVNLGLVWADGPSLQMTEAEARAAAARGPQNSLFSACASSRWGLSMGQAWAGAPRPSLGQGCSVAWAP